jgi:hypothetical protein
MANLVGKAMLSTALAATLAAPVWAQTAPATPLFTGEPVFLDPYNDLLNHIMPKKLAASAFPMVDAVAVDVQFGARLTDLDAYNAILAVLADGVRQKIDAMSAYAFVPGHRMLRVWEAPVSPDK